MALSLKVRTSPQRTSAPSAARIGKVSVEQAVRVSMLALDRHANQIAPLGPRAVIDTHLSPAEQFREYKIEDRGPMAHAAIGDHIFVGRGAGTLDQRANIRVGLERLVGIEQILEIQVFRAGNAPVAHGAYIGPTGTAHAQPVVLLVRAPIEDRGLSLPQRLQHLVAMDAHPFSALDWLILNGRG